MKLRILALAPALVLLALAPAYAQKTSATVNIPIQLYRRRCANARRRVHRLVTQRGGCRPSTQMGVPSWFSISRQRLLHSRRLAATLRPRAGVLRLGERNSGCRAAKSRRSRQW